MLRMTLFEVFRNTLNNLWQFQLPDKRIKKKILFTVPPAFEDPPESRSELQHFLVIFQSLRLKVKLGGLFSLQPGLLLRRVVLPATAAAAGGDIKSLSSAFICLYFRIWQSRTVFVSKLCAKCHVTKLYSIWTSVNKFSFLSENKQTKKPPGYRT